MIAVILSFIVGCIMGAFALMMIVIAMEDKKKGE